MLPESMFVNRKQEIIFLNKLYKQGNAELLLLYGRRQVGKTRRLKEFNVDFNIVN